MKFTFGLAIWTRNTKERDILFFSQRTMLGPYSKA